MNFFYGIPAVVLLLCALALAIVTARAGQVYVHRRFRTRDLASRRRRTLGQTIPIALIDARREPFGRELARDLLALQCDARHDRARKNLVFHLLRADEYALVYLRFFEIDALAFVQRAVDLGIAEIELARHRTHREFG